MDFYFFTLRKKTSPAKTGEARPFLPVSQYLHALNWLTWEILVCTLVVDTDGWRLPNDASKKSFLFNEVYKNFP